MGASSSSEGSGKKVVKSKIDVRASLYSTNNYLITPNIFPTRMHIRLVF